MHQKQWCVSAVAIVRVVGVCHPACVACAHRVARATTHVQAGGETGVDGLSVAAFDNSGAVFGVATCQRSE